MLPLGISIGIMIHRGRAALRSALDDARAVAEARPEEDVGVREEALLERDDDELCAAEPRAEEGADVLRVRQVQRRVDLVEDVHRCWLELQQRHDQRQRDQRPEFFFFFFIMFDICVCVCVCVCVDKGRHVHVRYGGARKRLRMLRRAPLATAEFC